MVLNPAPKPQRRRGANTGVPSHAVSLDTSHVDLPDTPAAPQPDVMADPVPADDETTSVAIPAVLELDMHIDPLDPDPAPPAPTLTTRGLGAPPPGPTVEGAPAHDTRERRRRRLFASHPTAAPLAVESLKSRSRLRKIIIGTGLTLVALMAVNTVIGVVNRPVDPATVAQQVAGMVNQDAALSAMTSTGQQFLTAYLTTPTDRPAEVARNAILDGMSNGQGSSWVSTPNSPEQVFHLVAGPDLIEPPRDASTMTGAAIFTYQAWLADGTGTVDRYTVAVPLSRDEAGVASVVAAPSILPYLPPGDITVETTPANQALTEAARPNLEQFLRLWAQAGPNASDDTQTQLRAYLAPDAYPLTRQGLSGQVEFAALSDLSLAPLSEGSPAVRGQATVTWSRANGEKFQQSYGIDMVQDGDKWFVTRVGLL